MGDSEPTSELVVLDETGSESNAGTDTIQVSDQDEDVDIVNSEGDVIVLDECTVDEMPPSSQQVADLGKKKHRDHSHFAPRHRKRSKRDKHSEHDLERRVKELKRDNDDLRAQLSKWLKRPSVAFGSENSPLIRVEFRDEIVHRELKDSVETFVTGLLKKYEEEAKNLFCVDNAKESKNGHCWEVPKYLANHDLSFANKTDNESVEEKKTNARPRVTCFNCLGDHMLNDCPSPLDRQAIAQNRRDYFNKFGGGRQTRYHVELDPKFSKYKAGYISEELRNALNLEKRQLPPYIYKMRQLGYPPGWLMEAQVVSSGLTMYDTHGKAVVDENLEEGEVAEPGDRQVQYDPAKLIEYPGFNIQPDTEYVEEFRKHGSIPMQQDHMLSYVALHMKPPQAKPFRRKSLVENKVSKEMVAARNDEDMEVEEIGKGDGIQTIDDDKKCVFIPPLPKESTQPKPPPPPPDTPSPTNKRPPSPSLEDLESAKKKLMLQLEQDTGSLADSGLESQSESLASSLGSTSEYLTPKQDKTVSRLGEGAAKDENAPPTRSASITCAFGTPIMNSVSPYRKLPEQDKFAIGITEHLPFENLPDSTGSFEKFRGLLGKIRTKFSL